MTATVSINGGRSEISSSTLARETLRWLSARIKPRALIPSLTQKSTSHLRVRPHTLICKGITFCKQTPYPAYRVISCHQRFSNKHPVYTCFFYINNIFTTPDTTL